MPPAKPPKIDLSAGIVNSPAPASAPSMDLSAGMINATPPAYASQSAPSSLADDMMHAGGEFAGDLWNTAKAIPSLVLPDPTALQDESMPIDERIAHTIPGGAGYLAAKGYVGGVQTALQRSHDEADQGDVAGSMINSVAAGLPLVGPLVSGVYEKSRGTTPEQATIETPEAAPDPYGAAGVGLSRVLQAASMAPEGSAIPNPALAAGRGGLALARRGASAIPKSIVGDMATAREGQSLSPAEVKAAAAQRGVKLTAGQITGNPDLTAAENIAGKSLGGRTIMDAQRQAAGKVLDVQSKSLIDDMNRTGGQYRGTSDAGQQANIGIDIAKEQAQTAAKSALDNFESTMKGTTVDSAPVRGWATQKLAEFKQIFENQMPEYSAKSSKILSTLQDLGEKPNPEAVPESLRQDISRLPGNIQEQLIRKEGFDPNAPETIHEPLDWNTVRRLKSDLYDMGNNRDLPAQARGLARQATEQFENLMQDHVTDTAGAKGLKQYRAANEQWSAYKDLYEAPDSKLASAVEQRYGKGTMNQLVSGKGDPQVIRELKLAKVDLSPLKQEVASRIMNSGWKIGAGKFGPFSGDFLTQLYSPAELRGLQEVGQMSRSLSPTTELRVNNMGKIARGMFRNPIAAKLFTSDWFREWMTNTSTGTGKSTGLTGGPSGGGAAPTPATGAGGGQGGTAPKPGSPPRPTADMSTGAGGANYSAADLAAFKARHGITAPLSLADDMAAWNPKKEKVVRK